MKSPSPNIKLQGSHSHHHKDLAHQKMRSPQTVKNANQHHQSINTSAKGNKSAIDNMNIVGSASSHKEINIKMIKGNGNHVNSGATGSISNHHSQTHLFEARRLSQ